MTAPLPNHNDENFKAFSRVLRAQTSSTRFGAAIPPLPFMIPQWAISLLKCVVGVIAAYIIIVIVSLYALAGILWVLSVNQRNGDSNRSARSPVACATSAR